MRLESILQRCIERKVISNDVKNEMFRIKLWFGLRDSNFCNVSCYKYDIINDFEILRRELCIIELDLELLLVFFFILIDKKKL